MKGLLEIIDKLFVHIVNEYSLISFTLDENNFIQCLNLMMHIQEFKGKICSEYYISA
jgi:hypothetical protein